MRIAVISDVHGNAVALQAVIDHIEKQKIDKIIFLGDLVMNGPHPKKCLEILKQLWPAVWIKGNTEYWLEEVSVDFIPKTEHEEMLYSRYKYACQYLTFDDIKLLLSKHDKCQFEIDGLKILCVHGSHRFINGKVGIMSSLDELEQITQEISEDILLCGHTHLPYYASLNGKKIINVGAVGLSGDGDSLSSYGVLDINNKIISYTNHKVPYDISQVLSDAAFSKFPYFDDYTKQLTAKI